jgi:organic hydroperoxide reductase OsmC/OhrA
MTSTVHRYRATSSWSGSTARGYQGYDRTHSTSSPPADGRWTLSGDPAFGGNPDYVNPESMLLMAASSCQLLSFLAVSARARIDVIQYADDAEAILPADDRPVRMTEIWLRPRIIVRAPATEARVVHLCEVAHRECYIANSLRTTINVQPDVTVVAQT